MNRDRASRGFFLVEFIFWMMVITLAAAGILPLFGQVLTTLHMPVVALQGHWLAQGMVEQMASVDFAQILPGECRKPDGTTPWADAATSLTCQVEVQMAEPDLSAHSVACLNQLYSSGNYKCAIVHIRHRQGNEPVARIKAIYARAADSL
ncbi:MAG: hypothetical protein H7835_06420 [Magnetococcus sp. XQGC-1]